MDTTVLTKRGYYLKGNTEKWFWLTTGLLIFNYLFSILSNNIIIVIFGLIFLENPSAMLVIGAIQKLLCFSADLIILLIYATQSRVKIYRIFFIVLICILFLDIIPSYLFTLGVVSLTLAEWPKDSPIFTAIYIESHAGTLVWISFTIIIIAKKDTSRELRTASIAMLAFSVFADLSGLFFSEVRQEYILVVASTISEILLSIINIFAQFFFYKAMALSYPTGWGQAVEPAGDGLMEIK